MASSFTAWPLFHTIHKTISKRRVRKKTHWLATVRTRAVLPPAVENSIEFFTPRVFVFLALCERYRTTSLEAPSSVHDDSSWNHARGLVARSRTHVSKCQDLGKLLETRELRECHETRAGTVSFSGPFHSSRCPAQPAERALPVVEVAACVRQTGLCYSRVRESTKGTPVRFRYSFRFKHDGWCLPSRARNTFRALERSFQALSETS